VFGDRKFGGNAQSITKNRWVHHTSFLWDYDVKNMSYLKLPAKVPQYRLVSLYSFSFFCTGVLDKSCAHYLLLAGCMVHALHSFLSDYKAVVVHTFLIKMT